MPCPPAPSKPTPVRAEHTVKGCVHYLDFESGQGSISSQKARPWIIIGRNNYNSSRVIISPVSDKKHYLERGTDILKYPYHVELNVNDYPFLDKDSVVLLDQVYTISKEELCEEWYVGRIDDMLKLDEAIMYNFDLFESIYKTYTDLMAQVKDIHVSKYSRK